METEQEQLNINTILSELYTLERVAAIDMEIKLAEGDLNGYKLKIGERMGIKECINVLKKYCS